MSTSELMRLMNRKSDLTEFNIIVKADVQGSLTAVIDSLKTLDTDEVAIRVVGSGVGAISDTDIHMARTSQAVIYGFNIQLPASVKRIASRDQVPIRLFSVIYELLDDAKASLGELLSPEIVERELGVLEVKGVFKTTRNEVICGGLVTSGKLTVPAQAQIIRGKEVIAEAKIAGLKRAQNDAKDIAEGEMCGMNLQTDNRVILEIGDRIRAYVREETARTL